MDISVVVPLFNAEAYIQECVLGLINQDYPPERYEIIMVDNNSIDRTVETVRRYPRIKLLHEPKQGAYCARNAGIVAAAGALIAFTDPDCRPYPDWLSSFYVAARFAAAGIFLGEREFGSGSDALAMLADYDSAKAEYVFSSGVKEIYYGYTNNMAIRKSLFQRLGAFAEVERGADTIFVRKAADACGCRIVRYSPDARIRHLEIRTVRDYYRKKWIYGGSNERNKDLGWARPLNSFERLRLFYLTARKRRYSIMKSCQLFALLALGMLYYESGRKDGSRAL